MTIPNPEHFFDQSERLLTSLRGAPRQVDIRRAISSAYYGAFHFILQKAADQFVGASAQARASCAYTLVYRSIAHGTLRELCESAAKPALSSKLKAFVPHGDFEPAVKAFATALLDLQEKRHSADYDPSLKFKSSDAITLVAAARSAINGFNKADAEQQRAFVALLVFKGR